MYVCPECAESYPAPGVCPGDGSHLSDSLTEPLLGQTIGSYRVAALLGVGGMGRVYKAVHPQIGSRVAIKVLSMECSNHPALVQRFFAEARSVNVIRHESIVNVLDLSQLSDGRPYIVMEYLDGQSLSDVIRERSPLPIGGSISLMCEILDALAAAHRAGIVHRDLKPDNIFVTAQGRPKVLDFGIAKLKPELGAPGDGTRTGSILGTPHYMSPEQAQGQPVDHRTDLYALGIILFELLTGARPFDAPTLYSLLDQHVKQPPPPVTQRRFDVPPVFDQLVFRALAKRPEQRFQTAEEMKQALESTLRALPPGSMAGIGASGGRPLGSGGPVPTIPSTMGGQVMSGSAPGSYPNSPRPGGAYGGGHPSHGGHPSLHGPSPSGYSAPPGAHPSHHGLGHSGGGYPAPPTFHGGQVEKSSPVPYLVFGIGAFVVISALGLMLTFGVSMLPTVGQPPPPAPLPVPQPSEPDGDFDEDPSGTGVPAVPSLPTHAGNARYDVSAELATAYASARKSHPTAQLAMLSANGVKRDGTVDLSSQVTNTVSFQFIATTGCVMVSVTQFGTNNMLLKKNECAGSGLRMPRCKLSVVMQRAAAQTKVNSSALGTVSYLNQDSRPPSWSVTFGVLSHAQIPDDC